MRNTLWNPVYAEKYWQDRYKLLNRRVKYASEKLYNARISTEKYISAPQLTRTYTNTAILITTSYTYILAIMKQQPRKIW